jgi:hypothetical protein
MLADINDNIAGAVKRLFTSNDETVLLSYDAARNRLQNKSEGAKTAALAATARLG